MSAYVPATVGRVRRALLDLEAWLDRPDVQAPGVSAWSAHRQVEHTVLVADRLLDLVARLDRGEAGESGGRLRWPGRIVLALGRIPRGRGQAPEDLRPQATPDVEAVRARLASVRTRLDAPRPRRRTPRAPHPHLGALDARQWRRFVDIHTRHHLAILRDIGRAARTGGR